MLSGATELPPLPPRDGDLSIEADVSREAAEAIHADAVRLNRGELAFIIPTFILAIAAAVVIALNPSQLWIWVALVGALFARVIQWGVEFVRLRRNDPVRTINAEFRDEIISREAAAACRRRARGDDRRRSMRQDSRPTVDIPTHGCRQFLCLDGGYDSGWWSGVHGNQTAVMTAIRGVAALFAETAVQLSCHGELGPDRVHQSRDASRSTKESKYVFASYALCA